MNIGREMVEEVGLEAACCICASVQLCRGASISTAEGFPDFRGPSGLFKLREVASASKHTNRAGFALVLGSSLKVAPARPMPGQVAKTGGRLVMSICSALILLDRPLW